MSNKVAIISPARNEKYLPQTVESCLSNARGEVEFIAVLEGYTPEGWPALQAKFPNLHTIYHSQPKGMRQSINEGAASAISRGARYLMKLDAHCMVPENFDMVLKADCDTDWIVVSRRKRLEPETWTLQQVGKPDIDYHYLSFPDDPKDFGGPGLNGKVWYERCKERAHIEIDDEMSSQGSGWFMHASYFQKQGFMDESKYGPFWNEFQELGLTCWLSGGQVKVNKRTWYAHWHKGKQGRGYSMSESWLKQGRNYTMNWLYNKASDKQTRPFKWLIEHFWPVPTWPENWERLVYGEKPVPVAVGAVIPDASDAAGGPSDSSLTIHSAYYGLWDTANQWIDVTTTLQSKVQNNSLDLMVTNADLEVGNPFRGKLKCLRVKYSYNGGEVIEKWANERDWLIIGQSERYVNLGPRSPQIPVFTKPVNDDFPKAEYAEISGTVGNELFRVKLEPVDDVAAPVATETPATGDTVAEASGGGTGEQSSATVVTPNTSIVPTHDHRTIDLLLPREKLSPQGLNDFLVRRFAIPPHRLRGPMPIEVPSFHRDDLARLFAELGFKHGAEIGVAEGKYSEVLLRSNPDLHLLCVDPWHAYPGNTQQKSSSKHDYAYSETRRRTADYKAQLVMKTSMEAVREVKDGSLDFVYLDANHSFDYVIEDLINWTRKVRQGGIIAGDDYYYLDPKRWGAGPVEAVTAYTQAHKISPWFIFNAHRSIDFCWVKQ